MTNARLDDGLAEILRPVHNDRFLQDPAGLETAGELVDGLRAPRYRPMALFALVGRIRACHLEATSAGADDDLERFWESILLARNSGCSMSASKTRI